MADNGLWAKLWFNALTDRELDTLDIADFGRWCKLLAYIKNQGDGGKITLKAPERLLISMLQISNFNELEKLIKKFPNISVTCNDSEMLHTLDIQYKPEKWKRYQGDSSKDRVKKHREIKAQNKPKKPVTKPLHVTAKEVEVEVEVDVEKEVEEEKKKDIYSSVRVEIIEDFNKTFETKYRPNTQDIKKHVNARLEEGFTLEDFKQVHQNMKSAWQGTDMQKYLRPQTLYLPKFSSYLNQIKTPVKSKAEIELEEKKKAMTSWMEGK